MLLCLQAERANSISHSQAMGSKVNYQVADALHQPFRDGQFDLIWSMESGEHMPDKAQFISELTRVCKPGGKILIVTWCHRCATCTKHYSLTGLLPTSLVSEQRPGGPDRCRYYSIYTMFLFHAHFLSCVTDSHQHSALKTNETDCQDTLQLPPAVHIIAPFVQFSLPLHSPATYEPLVRTT